MNIVLGTIIPWFVYGVTLVYTGTIVDNPPPNANGVVGEVTAMPYTVPEGYRLTVTEMQVEGPACDYSCNWSQFGMNLWLGEPPCLNAKGIVSCTTVGGSHQNNDMAVTLDPGTIVNIRLMNNTNLDWVDGWYLQGYLESIE